MTSQTRDPTATPSARHGFGNNSGREEDWSAEILCPLLRRAGRINVTMKIDRIRYNRPELPLEISTAPSPTPRDFAFTATQRQYIQDYIARSGVNTPGSHQVRDNVLFSHLNIAMTDKERAMMCRKGPTYAIQQKVLGGDRYVLPQTRPLGSLVVRQISPENKRATSAFPSSDHAPKNRKCDIRYRNTGLFKRFQTDATEIAIPDESHHDVVAKNSERLVHFAENMPKARNGNFHWSGLEVHCACRHQLGTSFDDRRDVRSCSCPINRAEMVLPKVDLTSAIEDGVRATVHAILSNSSHSPRHFLSQREQTILTLLSSREFGEKQPEAKKVPRRLQLRRSLTPRQSHHELPDAGHHDYKRPSTPTKDMVRDAPRKKTPTEYTASLTDTEAIPDSPLIGFHIASPDRRVARCPSARRCPSPRQSVKMQTFRMSMPS